MKIIQDSIDYTEVEMSKEKLDFIKKNENNYNFCAIPAFVYYILMLAI